MPASSSPSSRPFPAKFTANSIQGVSLQVSSQSIDGISIGELREFLRQAEILNIPDNCAIVGSLKDPADFSWHVIKRIRAVEEVTTHLRLQEEDHSNGL